MLLSATSQFQFGHCICSHFIVAGNFTTKLYFKIKQRKIIQKQKKCHTVTALQHLLQLGPSFLSPKALMIFILHQNNQILDICVILDIYRIFRLALDESLEGLTRMSGERLLLW